MGKGFIDAAHEWRDFKILLELLVPGMGSLARSLMKMGVAKGMDAVCGGVDDEVSVAC